MPISRTGVSLKNSRRIITGTFIPIMGICEALSRPCQSYLGWEAIPGHSLTRRSVRLRWSISPRLYWMSLDCSGRLRTPWLHVLLICGGILSRIPLSSSLGMAPATKIYALLPFHESHLLIRTRVLIRPLSTEGIHQDGECQVWIYISRKKVKADPSSFFMGLEQISIPGNT